MQRNLIYYVLPIKGTGVWQRNVAALNRRADLFDGIRRVVVAEQVEPSKVPGRLFGATTDPWEEVRDALPGFDVTPIKHNPVLRETAAFTGLLAEALEQPGVTFFGHAKGVTWPLWDGNVTVHAWTALMYSACLDYWPLVERAFERHVMAGSLRLVQRKADTVLVAQRKNGRLVYVHTHKPAQWHYTGTFFWFDNAAVKRREHEPRQDWLGTELWPGRVFRTDEAACLFGDNVERPPYVWNVMTPMMGDFHKWAEANAEHRRPGVSALPWNEYVLA